MNKIMLVCLSVASVCGCRSVTVKNYGQDYARDNDGNPIVVNGAPVILSRGWYVSHWQHWMITKADSVTATIKPDDIGFAINGLDEKSDGEGLATVVEKSLSGAAELAAKIGAAIASCGGSAAGDSISGLVKQFVAKGGDITKATVECKDGSCTVSDGSVTCTDGRCYAN